MLFTITRNLDKKCDLNHLITKLEKEICFSIKLMFVIIILSLFLLLIEA